MKALVLLSGGVDSATCLALAVEKYGGGQVLALAISYGQKHLRELEAARQLAAYYQVRYQALDLKQIFEGSHCSLLQASGAEIPHEAYARQLEKTQGDPVSTYVPFRNGLFLSCAAAIAMANGCREIFYGIHQDDAAGNAYPDTSEEFHRAMQEAVFVGSGGQVKMEAPFVQKTKADIVQMGLALHVPYELTWSCYEGREKACGTCGTCLDRKKAFRLNGAVDPIAYEGE